MKFQSNFMRLFFILMGLTILTQTAGAQSVLIDYSHFAAAQGNARPIRRVYDLTGRYDAWPMPSARGFSQAEFLDFGERWVGEPVLPGGWRAGNQPGDKWQP